jgi:coproporphyrinogen III oxidase-like Fe-S oxidoreductase
MSDDPASPITSLYVHVPFCAHKCEYCAFYSEPSAGEKINRYVSALIGEMELVATDLKPRTVFFGGGTPSLLTLGQWERVFRAMDRLKLLGADEWTIECNPATVSLDKAQLWRSHGVNRVSMGVQSLNETLLDRLGRIHTREMVFKSFDILRRGGFDNLNLDLMFAIPGQTVAMWQDTLNEALALGSEHLSSYEVIYEEDTPLFEQLQAGQFSVNEDLACEMYETLVTTAHFHGLHQYEIANFARENRRSNGAANLAGVEKTHSAPALQTASNPAETANSELRTANPEPRTPRLSSTLDVQCSMFDARLPAGTAATLHDSIPSLACQHNVNYWRGGFFYGLGPSAAGFVRGVRTKNWSNTILYCEQLERGRRAVESRDELPPLARAGEIAAFGLRMNAGWPFAEFRLTTGFDLQKDWSDEMNQLVNRGWATVDAERFRLTPAGLRFADSAAEEFLRG